MIRFEWGRECKDVFDLSNMGNEISLPETRAEATENYLGELSEGCQQQAAPDVPLDVYYTFLGYRPCSNEGDRVKSRIAQLARFDTWTATVVTCLTE